MAIQHLGLCQGKKDQDHHHELGNLNGTQYRLAEHLSQKDVSYSEKHHKKKGYRGNVVYHFGYGMDPGLEAAM
jgi:hypothetical protein